MTRRLLCNFVALCAIGFIVGSARTATGADDSCFYNGTMYSHGAAACQSGLQFRCDDGEWKNLKIPCTGGNLTLSRTCEFRGISFSTGAASCQAGTQFRCEDGVWHSLAMPCASGDSPIRIVPSGRTCMYGDATVSNNSTMCRSGITFLCSDGEWVNLGTLCR